MEFDVRADGYLSRVNDWNEDVAKSMAKKEGIELTPAHWEIINIIRDFYNTYNISPIRKLLFKEIAEKLSPEKTDFHYLDALFPHDVLIQGTRIAGVPRPVYDVELETSSELSRIPQLAKTFVTELSFQDKIIKIYPNGNLINLNEWDESVAGFLAEKEGITLTPEHWEIINFLREFYFKFGIAPMVRLLMKHMAEQLGPIKSSEEYLYKLFPKGPARQGSRIAGLPEPQGCIDP